MLMSMIMTGGYQEKSAGQWADEAKAALFVALALGLLLLLL